MSQKNINNGLIKEDYCDIKTYVIHNGAVSLGEIPEGAVCRTYPEKQLATGCMSSTKAFRAMPIITICSP